MTIVGAGVVGICAASYLQRAGCRVTVLDPVAPGQSTSFGNAGGLSPDSFVPVAAPGILKQIPKWLLQENGPLIVRWSYLPKALPWLWRFVKEASPSRFEQNADAMKALMAPVFECYAPLLKDARAEHLIHRVGQLYVYSSDKAFAGDRPILEMRQRKGAKIEILSAGEIRETEPALAHIFRRGVLLPNHGHCANPAGLVAALAETFVRNGGQILPQRVLSMDVGGDRVDRIVTEGGVRPVDVLLLAAGVWSGRLAAMLGHNVPIESHRGYHVTLADPSMRPRRNVG